jgi:hypothetical protein
MSIKHTIGGLSLFTDDRFGATFRVCNSARGDFNTVLFDRDELTRLRFLIDCMLADTPQPDVSNVQTSHTA